MSNFSEKFFAKIITVALTVAIAIPASFAFIPAKKAEASFTVCFAAFFSALGISIGNSTAVAVVSVPVAANGQAYAQSQQSGNAQGNLFKECIEKPFVTIIVKSMLAKMTQEIVDWINGGFNGSPAFLSDPGNFLLNVGDQVAGEFILGTDLAFLCSPFKLQIQLSLALNYSHKESGAAKAACTLSQVIGNVDAAVDNLNKDFSGGGGWNSWFAISQGTNNNVYGSYLEASSNMSAKVSKQQNKKLVDLSWSGGFLSSETCTGPNGETYDNQGGILTGNIAGEKINTDSANQDSYKKNKDAWNKQRAEEMNDPNFMGPPRAEYKVDCKTVTPGRTIAGVLDKTLNVTTDQVGLAEDLDQIFNALANQLIMQVFQKGLAGASRSDSSGKSPLKQFVDSTAQEESAAYDESNTKIGDVTESNNTSGSLPGGAQGGQSTTRSNIAQGGNVWATPGIMYNSDPLDVTDGNTKSSLGPTGDFSGVVTALSTSPTLTVALKGQTAQSISQIVVFQRTNPGDGSTSYPPMPFVVQVLTDQTSTTAVWTSQQYIQDFSGPIEIDVPSGINGRYVRLVGQSTTPGKLEIAEVQVYNNVPPSITLNGSNPSIVQVGGTFTDPGAKANDTRDGDISANIQVSGTVDTSTAGNYTLTYTVANSSGMTSNPVIRTVVVQANTSYQPPAI